MKYNGTAFLARIWIRMKLGVILMDFSGEVCPATTKIDKINFPMSKPLNVLWGVSLGSK